MSFLAAMGRRLFGSAHCSSCQGGSSRLPCQGLPIPGLVRPLFFSAFGHLAIGEVFDYEWGVNPTNPSGVRFVHVLPYLILGLGLGAGPLCRPLAGAETPGASSAVVISTEGTVQVLARGGKEWQAAKVGQDLGTGYRLRTGSRSRALLRLANLSVLRVSELMEYQLEPPRVAGGKSVLNLKAGTAYLFQP